MKEFLTPHLELSLGSDVEIIRQTEPSDKEQKLLIKNPGKFDLYNSVLNVIDRFEERLNHKGVTDIKIVSETNGDVAISYYFKNEQHINRIVNIINRELNTLPLELEKLSLVHMHYFIVKIKPIVNDFIDSKVIKIFNDCLKRVISHLNSTNVDGVEWVIDTTDLEANGNLCWLDMRLKLLEETETRLTLSQLHNRITPETYTELMLSAMFKGKNDLSRKSPTTDGGIVDPENPKKLGRVKILGYHIAGSSLTVDLEHDGSISTTTHNRGILKKLMVAFGYGFIK